MSRFGVGLLIPSPAQPWQIWGLTSSHSGCHGQAGLDLQHPCISDRCMQVGDSSSVGTAGNSSSICAAQPMGYSTSGSIQCQSKAAPSTTPPSSLRKCIKPCREAWVRKRSGRGLLHINKHFFFLGFWTLAPILDIILLLGLGSTWGVLPGGDAVEHAPLMRVGRRVNEEAHEHRAVWEQALLRRDADDRLPADAALLQHVLACAQQGGVLFIRVGMFELLMPPCQSMCMGRRAAGFRSLATIGWGGDCCAHSSKLGHTCEDRRQAPCNSSLHALALCPTSVRAGCFNTGCADPQHVNSSSGASRGDMRVIADGEKAGAAGLGEDVAREDD